MRWLLLTDLHIGRNNEAQEAALTSLVRAIEVQTRSNAIDLVLLAGDLAYSGKASEYQRVKTLVIDPLRSLPEFTQARFIAVPGNHDVDCDRSYPPALSTLGPEKSQQFFHLNATGKRLRQIRAPSFKAYAGFLEDAHIEGVDPTSDSGVAFEIQSETTNIQLISVVTAFFSSKDLHQEKHNVPAPIHPIRHFLDQTTDSPYRFIIAHHPPDWFTPESHQHLESLLVERDAIYIHGHEHRIQAHFGRKGLTSIGFGAAYQAPLESHPTSSYRNSFAICELNESLHIAVTAWDSENGNWVDETTLPANFDEKSSIIRNASVLPIPTSLLRNRTTSLKRRSLTVAPSDPHLAGCYWVARNHKDRWLQLLYELELVDTVDEVFRPSSETMPEGHIELRLKTRGTNLLVHAVSGHGDVISNDRIVSLNTQLDSDEISSCTIMTLGEFDDAATKLVDRLRARKPIHAIDRSQFERLWFTRSTSPLVAILRSLDLSIIAATLLISDRGYGLVLMDQLRSDWFQVLDESAVIIDESSSLVYDLRENFPIFHDLTYRVDSGNYSLTALRSKSSTQQNADDQFSRSDYLSAAHTEFDAVRYQPLAALGFKFRDTSLSDIYIQTSADTTSRSKTTQTLERAVSEYLQSLNLEGSLRDQIESQLRSRYGLSRRAEAGLARKLYQRHGNVVVLGDPGSGKTCFVKSEILAYCSPPEEGGSWYLQHLPIYVPLAEAAELMRTNDDFLSACSVISARRRLRLDQKTIQMYLSDGRVAFFFDGLDEVSRVDERASLLRIIDDLVTRFASYGNRFVLTSRPAAIQPVDIPDALTYLHLKGLTDAEIRILAQRVLTTRLGVSEEEDLAAGEIRLVDKLLAHVQDTPGLRRISTNPLLLTLLVLIYANTGTLSARRHVVYTQAVKTLVSFRHREMRDQVLPEADLRTRLGRLAFAIYHRDVSELPGRTEVVTLLSSNPTVASEVVDSQRMEAEDFLRRVAESTGLLVIHPRSDGQSDAEDVISFMHHSFLEYYTAIGFLVRDFESEIPRVANHPYWRDVITLMFGLLSEHQDISTLLNDMVRHQSELELVTNGRLRLAFDCALECEVPPQESQGMLSESLRVSLTRGALRYSDRLRESFATPVDRLLVSAGGAFFEAMFLEGIQSEDAGVAAAFIDFVGRLTEVGQFDPKVVGVFEEIVESRDEAVIRVACSGVVMRRAEFRTERALRAMEACFQGNLVQKHSILETVASSPSLSRRFEDQLGRLLDDSNNVIASLAAQCVLMSGSHGAEFRFKETVIRKAVMKWQSAEATMDAGKVSLTVDPSDLREFLDSSDPSDVAFAVSLIPLADLDSRYSHKVLVDTLRSNSHHLVIRACLDSLQKSEKSLDLITLAETDHICGLVRSKYRDVRIGAIRVLGMLPNDEQVVSTLLLVCGLGSETTRDPQSGGELDEGIKAIVRHARKDARLRKFVVTHVISSLPQPSRGAFGDPAKQRRIRSMLSACERIGGIIERAHAARILGFAKDYRTPVLLRAQALRVYGRTVQPTGECIDELISFLEMNHNELNQAAYSSVFWFLLQCKKRVEFVRGSYSKFPTLKEVLIRVWEREGRRVTDRIDSIGLDYIQRSLSELESLILSYGEFSERMKLVENANTHSAVRRLGGVDTV